MPSKLHLVTILWACLSVSGLMGMMVYSKTPGQKGQIPAAITPADSGRGQLLVFLHPQCVCSRATVRHLMRLSTKQRAQWDTVLYIFQPSEIPKYWSESGLGEKQLHFATRKLDVDGAKARELGVHTSGHVIAYSANGKRLFSGGITAGRGHEGSNTAFSTLQQLLLNPQSPSENDEFPVFGCGLQEVSKS